MGSREILRIDKANIAGFQKEQYLPKTENETVETRFSLDFIKRAQANKIKVKMDQSPTKDGEVVYTASQMYDTLLSVSAHINLLPIKVKDQYKSTVSIAYHHNIGHNILYEGECKIDNEYYGQIDSVYLDIHSQYNVKKRELYDRMVGNIPCLEEWGTELPALPLIVPQPYSFSRNTRVSIPLLKSKNNTVTFRYKVRTKLVDLIKMRIKRKDGTYKELSKCKLIYLDTKNTDIPIPEMWGRYGEMTDEERNWRKSIDMKTGEPLKQTIYIEDVEKISSGNPITIGTKETLSLCGNAPAKHVFWVASLVDSGFSNYTTNRNDLYKGYNPCAKACIKYGTSDRVEECGYEHFELQEVYDHDFVNFPREAGYNVYTYTFNPNEIQHADTAVSLKDCAASLTVLLGDTNPFLNKDEEEEYHDENGEAIPVEALEDHIDESKKDKYVLHVRTIVARKLEVFWNDKVGALRYIFTST